MTPVAAVHHEPGSFSDRWIAELERRGVPVRLVDCTASDVMQKLQGAQYLLWHWNHADPAAWLIARSVLAAAQRAGIRVFPDLNTCWSFDDKLAQKYVLEAIGAPLVPTFAFFSVEHALAWIDRTSFPKVFKLRRGAGSSNVKLVGSRSEARELTAKLSVAASRACPALFRPRKRCSGASRCAS
jgi:hypothetical protein